MALSCIVFDCDGIILESVDAKTAAFSRISDEVAPNLTGSFIDYVVLHGGVSRFEKFSWLIRQAFGRDITPEESRDFGEKFIHYCLEAVVASPLVPGFEETAKRWHGRVPLYVASGTPQYELDEVLRRRGLDGYFTKIYGTPPAKAALLLNALRDSGAAPEETVMVGDSKTDMDAAIIAGTLFYGRGDYFKNTHWPWGSDLTPLNDYLDAVAAGKK
ncbi:MAG: HAD hydrolase-like protein [Deltaproteobacteria bacterium]|nr:HAD hydrolase-like protein [Deltaproteobacteria bacterium]